MSPHRVQVFHGGSFVGPQSYGWQCFTCGAERDGFRTITDAEADADMHGERI